MRFDRFDCDIAMSKNAQDGRGYTRAALPSLQLIHHGYYSKVEGRHAKSFCSPPKPDMPGGGAEPGFGDGLDPMYYACGSESKRRGEGEADAAA